MKWRVELTREQFATYAMHVEWAVMAQHAALVAKPQRSIGHLRAPVAIALSAGLVGLGIALRSSEPEIGNALVVGFSLVLAAWAIVLVRRIRPRKHAGDRIRVRVARLPAKRQRQLPSSIDYSFHEGLRAARAIVALDVVALFRREISELPSRIIFDPPAAFIEELRHSGTEVIEVTEPQASYTEPLPVARQV
jgi:hypothetical protein